MNAINVKDFIHIIVINKSSKADWGALLFITYTQNNNNEKKNNFLFGLYTTYIINKTIKTMYDQILSWEGILKIVAEVSVDLV